MTPRMNLVSLILLIALCFTAGFFVGRVMVQRSEKIEQKPGKTVYAAVNVDALTKPKEFKTDIQFLPYRFWKADTVLIIDSIIDYVELIPDTAKIVKDFILKREYDFTAFDDKINGRLDVKQVIQYNRLQSFDYSFTPIVTTKTVVKENLFTPFISAGYNTFEVVGFGGGLFIKNLGIEYNYLYHLNNPYNINYNNTKQNGHSFSIKYKF